MHSYFPFNCVSKILNKENEKIQQAKEVLLLTNGLMRHGESRTHFFRKTDFLQQCYKTTKDEQTLNIENGKMYPTDQKQTILKMNILLQYQILISKLTVPATKCTCNQ